MMAEQVEFFLDASPETVHWGFFDANLKPVLRVPSGALVGFGAEPAAVPEIVEEMKPKGSEAFRRIVASQVRGPSSHVMTGPVYVEGAEPGDVLEVFFKSIRFRYDWGFNAIIPLKGGLAEEYPSLGFIFPSIDKKARTASWNGIGPLPLAPFFGDAGVAPPASLGRVPSGLPGAWGGNMDNKELVEGTKLLLPVFNKGALFSLGDGHACQGDGEVNSFALETGLDADLRLTVLKDMTLRVPMIVTPTHTIFMGFDPILDNAAKNALREAVEYIASECGYSSEDAYALCSMAGDLRITQIVNGTKGAHFMIANALLKKSK
jgi:acetamidase/formamidase